MDMHERAHALVRAVRDERAGAVPPEFDQVVRFYVSAKALYDRAAEHVVRNLAKGGAR
jgi:hypothetical protein